MVREADRGGIGRRAAAAPGWIVEPDGDACMTVMPAWRCSGWSAGTLVTNSPRAPVMPNCAGDRRAMGNYPARRMSPSAPPCHAQVVLCCNHIRQPDARRRSAAPAVTGSTPGRSVRSGRFAMRAQPGDSLGVHSHRGQEVVRRAEIVSTHANGEPPFTVRWTDDNHESVVFPGPDAQIIPSTG